MLSLRYLLLRLLGFAAGKTISHKKINFLNKESK
jgi:hypothetical protein